VRPLDQQHEQPFDNQSVRLIMGVYSTGALGCCVVVHEVHRSSHQYYLTYMV
jgi:hypothetical protein